MPKVSVIVPVYNVEQYLERSMNCLLNQTLKDIEIICIDDCSTDNSLEILKKYEKLDSKFKIISLNKNQGAAVARNKGLEIADGEYLGFMDPDDSIDLNFYEELYKKAKEDDFDIVKGKRLIIKTNGKVIDSKINNDIRKNKYEFYGEWTTAIYKTSFIHTNNIIFTPEIIKSHDLLFLNKVILKAKSINTTDKVYYYYYKRENSLNASYISIDKFSSACKAIKLITDDINNSNLYKDDLENYILLYKTKCLSLLKTFYQNRSEEASNICIKTFFDCYDKCKNKDELKKYLPYNENILKIFDNHQTKELINTLNKFDNRNKFSKANNKKIYKNFGELIFSIKIENNHKIITVAGIKIKIKRKKRRN